MNHFPHGEEARRAVSNHEEPPQAACPERRAGRKVLPPAKPAEVP